jgi:hypothetical protein
MLKIGDEVIYTSYWKTKTGIVSHFSKDGKLVCLKGGRWVHRESIAEPMGELLAKRRKVGLFNHQGEMVATFEGTEEQLSLVTLQPGWSMRDV